MSWKAKYDGRVYPGMIIYVIWESEDFWGTG